MTNHPNRAWRTRMTAACAIWLQAWGWQAAPGARLVSEPELRGIMRDSYFDGYEAGRASMQPKPKTGE